jgi:hypothetical protein
VNEQPERFPGYDNWQTVYNLRGSRNVFGYDKIEFAPGRDLSAVLVRL